MDFTIRDLIDELFEKIRKYLEPYLKQTEEKGLRETELKLTIGIYACFNILAYFFVSWDIFVYWLCINVFIGFLLKNIFFPGSFQKVNRFERVDQTAPTTFFEGGFFQAPETIVEKRAQPKKAPSKKLNETFELKTEEPSPNRSFTTIRGTSLRSHKPQKSEERKITKILEEEPKEPAESMLVENFDINTITKQIPDLKQSGRRNLSAISEVLTESEADEIQSANKPKPEEDLISMLKEPRGRVIRADWADSVIEQSTPTPIPTPTVKNLEDENLPKTEVREQQPETSFFQQQASTSPFFAELAKNMTESQSVPDWGSSIKESQQSRSSEPLSQFWSKVTIEKEPFENKKENITQTRSLFTNRVITPPFENERPEPMQSVRHSSGKEISFLSNKPRELSSEKKEIQGESMFANRNMNTFAAPKLFQSQNRESLETQVNKEANIWESNRNSESFLSEKKGAQVESSSNKSLNTFPAPNFFQTQNRESLDKNLTKENFVGEGEKKEVQMENSFSNKSLSSFPAPKLFQTQNRESLDKSWSKESTTGETAPFSTKKEAQMENSFLNRSLNSSFKQDNLSQSFRSDDLSKSKAGKVSFKPSSTTAKMHSLLARNDDDD